MPSKKVTRAANDLPAVALPRLTLIPPPERPRPATRPSNNSSMEWDPYVVWRRHIRPDSDAA